MPDDAQEHILKQILRLDARRHAPGQERPELPRVDPIPAPDRSTEGIRDRTGRNPPYTVGTRGARR